MKRKGKKKKTEELARKMIVGPITSHKHLLKLNKEVKSKAPELIHWFIFNEGIRIKAIIF